MKNKLLLLAFSFCIILGCKNSENNDNSKKQNTEINTSQDCAQTLSDLRELQRLIIPTPDDLHDQNSEIVSSIPQNTNMFPVTGTIDIEKDIIDLKIYTTEAKLKIINYINLSTKHTNAILIVLDGNEGNPSKDGKNNYSINKKLKISKLGLSKTMLKKHNALSVIVLHDDDFSAAHALGYQRRVINYPNYEDFDNYLQRNWKIDFMRPNEDGGDIIP